MVSSGYRVSRRAGWEGEGRCLRASLIGCGSPDQQSAASSLSTFVMPSKCVRACHVPTDKGGKERGRGHPGSAAAGILHVHVHAGLARSLTRLVTQQRLKSI